MVEKEPGSDQLLLFAPQGPGLQQGSQGPGLQQGSFAEMSRGLPPARRLGRSTRGRKKGADDGQLTLFKLSERPAYSSRRLLRRRLRGKPQPQTYLELACALGLPHLQALLKVPATYFLFDSETLKVKLRVATLLDARARVLEQLQDAFEDLADMAPLEVRMGRLSLWGGRRLGIGQATNSDGETLSLALATTEPRVADPFVLRLRGVGGFLGARRGPPPYEEGEELLSLYDGTTLYNLLPLEMQPMPLNALLYG